MNIFLQTIPIFLIIGWVIGFFVYSGGYLIHSLLILAIIAILFRVIKGREPF